MKLGVNLRKLFSSGDKASFSPNIGAAIVILLLSAFAGWLFWFVYVHIKRTELDSAAQHTESPFLAALKGTPYDPTAVSRQQKTNDNEKLGAQPEKQKPGSGGEKQVQVKVYENSNGLLELALTQMRLRNSDGKPFASHEIKALVKVVRPYLVESGKPEGVILTMTSSEVVARLVTESKIAGNGGNGTKIIWSSLDDELVEAFKKEHAIVRSKEFLAGVLSEKETADAIIPNAAGPLADPPVTPPSNLAGANELAVWPAEYQLMLRCLQSGQNDEILRDARFNLTFVEGWDVMVMCMLTCEVLFSLLARAHVARREHRFVIEKAQDGHIGEWVKILEKGEPAGFKTVKTGLATLEKEARNTAPLFSEMLEVVRTELAIRENHSLPDSLLNWTHGVRDEITSSRWYLGWCGRALPTIGFIFKVYAIALAMKDSYSIALSDGSFDQAASISNVSGALGMAFSATFVAFILSLAIGFFDSWESHYERSVLADLEQLLIPLLRVPPAP